MTTPATVLIVDDERELRRIARRALELDQVTVVEAEDGVAALTLIERDEPPLDLVVTDLVMPRLGGMELVATLRRYRPDLPIVVISGWAQSASTRALLEEHRIPVLAKPFTPLELTSVVRQSLEEARRNGALPRSGALAARPGGVARRQAGELVAAAYKLRGELGTSRL